MKVTDEEIIVLPTRFMTGFITKKIRRTRILSEVLRAARQKRELTLEQVEAATCIPAKYLSALENGQFDLLPAEAYNVGYVRNYAKYLKLDPENVIAMYREERTQAKVFAPSAKRTVQLIPRRMSDWHFLITPKLLAFAGTLLLFGSMTAYVIVQLNRFSQPPVLEIVNSISDFTSSQDTVMLKGKTAAGSAVTINSEAISVGSDGYFTQEVQLSPGLNEIVVRSQNRAQKSTVKAIKALYNPDLAKATR